MFLKIRQIQKSIIELHAKSRGRILVLTGARQTGKSTLAQLAFSNYPIINLDSPIERSAYERMSPAQWITQYPFAVIDEAQKLPSIFDTVKACFDRDEKVRYVLLGSSQVLLMKRVKETLAGRAALKELFPFSLPELVLENQHSEPSRSRLIQLFEASSPLASVRTLFRPDIVSEGPSGRASTWWQKFLHFGGMPALWAPDWTDEDRFEWLGDYHSTYLQRDLADLYRLDRLEPFVRAQKAAALRTSQPINISELARLSDVSAPTAKQFMRYLEISYQIVWLPAWFRNPEKRLMKRPKLHFLDPGIRRAILGKRGEVDGAEYESGVVAELTKQLRSAKIPVSLYHIRTTDGREVDLLIEREDGYIAIECKQSDRVYPQDFRHLRDLQEILDKPLLLGLVVSEDPYTKHFETIGPQFHSLPAYALFSGPE